MGASDLLRKEEFWNSISHGVGIPLGLAALMVGVTLACMDGDPWKIATVTVYGVTLVLMYTASTIYHASTGRTKRVWNLMDHVSVFLLIAGTYTPVTLVGLRGPLGWTLFGVVWVLALAGIVMKAITRDRTLVLGTVIYALMGWLIVIPIQHLIAHLPMLSVQLIFGGGLFYTFGLVFFAWRRRYMHFVWHLFVIAGSALHYFAVLTVCRVL